jgi:hypothetical protein
MSKVILNAWRSDALAETGMWTKQDDPPHVQFGPYEYIELTYESVRVSPDGEWIGEICPEGYWHMYGHKTVFSDLTISSVDE